MANILEFNNPSKDDILKIVRELIGEDDGCIVWTHHALEQMEKREISNTQVIRCLQKGVIVEWPCFNAAKGSYKFTVTFTVTHTTAGKEISTAAAVNLKNKIIVITVM
ncbi:MAG: DUF4258 domain-containing protein [Alphaproteobacteria bacterium]|nr:DUF4258 domain-containing protein [Alphaproteobacteria bacterium]